MSASLAFSTSGSTFIGGVIVPDTSNSSDLTIVSPAHPLIASGLPCPGGNCGVVVDTAAFTDIDGWTESAHGVLTNLPAGTTVILTGDASGGGPVAVEYSHGAGKVVANTLTDSWMYGGGHFPIVSKKIVANDIAYQNSLAPIIVGGIVPKSVIGN